MPSAATIHVNVLCGDEGAWCGAQELGAGCGLSGMVAAAAGAGHVVLADQVLYMLQENVARNFAERPEIRERIAVRELQWGVSRPDTHVSLEIICVAFFTRCQRYRC